MEESSRTSSGLAALTWVDVIGWCPTLVPTEHHGGPIADPRARWVRGSDVQHRVATVQDMGHRTSAPVQQLSARLSDYDVYDTCTRPSHEVKQYQTVN